MITVLGQEYEQAKDAAAVGGRLSGVLLGGSGERVFAFLTGGGGRLVGRHLWTARSPFT